MCGIFFSLLPSSVVILDLDRETLCHRGPDYYSEQIVCLNDQKALVISSVLHLRGHDLVKQPLLNDLFVLQWNGEVFAGNISIPEGENDTKHMFNVMSLTDDISSVMRSVEGPYAFVLVDIAKEQIWYGRDLLGRRSLLKHKKDFVLSSIIPVSSSPGEWEEVPVGGIFRYDWKTQTTDFITIHKPLFQLNRSVGIADTYPVAETLAMLRRSIQKRLVDLKICGVGDSVAVLFSGGVDSSVLTKILDEMLPAGYSIDLLNVAFQNERFLHSRQNTDMDDFKVPDRLTGLQAYKELKAMNPERKFNFVNVDISIDQYFEAKSRVTGLMQPNNTVLDLSISIALWFAASRQGTVVENDCKTKYKSASKIVFVGSGADEQLGGYSRHRNRWDKDNLAGLLEELELDVSRIPYRNLGRDDRCISDCGVEPRFPYLDEELVQYLSALPISQKMDLSLPRGDGEKRLLRLIAKSLGFSDQIAFLPKRAIQFGAKTAKIEGSRKQKGDETLENMGNIGNEVNGADLLKEIEEKLVQVDRFSMKNCQSLATKYNRLGDSNPFEVDFQRLSIYNTMKDLELEELLQVLQQKHLVNNDQWFKNMRRDFEFCKIGESSFCEVYVARGLGCSTQRAIKIMPLQCEGQKENVVPEPVPMSKALHECRVQLALNSLTCCRRYCIPSEYTGFNCSKKTLISNGKYPDELIALWDKWDGASQSSENCRPDFYTENSLFMIMEMNYDGNDLEDFVPESAEQIKSIVLQITFALALAETELKFEHRDLHLGNVLLRPTKTKMIRIDSTNQIVSEGCLVSIIDFSLSRLQSGRRLLYSDLSADEWLFNADAGKSKQYDVYRRMKSLIKEDWSGFYPQTNLFWLEYVTETLLSRLPASKQKSKVGLEITEFLKSDCTKYESCQDLISKGMNGMYKY